jgi:hypothetical protein
MEGWRAEAMNLNRRQLLKAGGIGFGGAALSSLSVPGCANPAGLNHKALAGLARDLKGRLLLPGDEAYPLAAAPNNARWASVHPEAVAMCADDSDVQKCVNWVREEGRQVAIRSGGHSLAGFSTTTGLLIDVKPMNKVTFDADRGVAHLQGGANNQDMADALRDTGFAVPSGRCPTVGVAGLVLGGGWGFSATRFGLTCDNLISTDIVTADGTKRTVGESSVGDDADLFWALRGGGGGNFGVNTSFVFQAHEVPDVTVFSIAWQGDKQVEVVTALQQIQNGNASNISSRTRIAPRHPGQFPRRSELDVYTLGVFFGSVHDLREVMAPAFTILQPAQQDIRTMSYWQARDYLVTDEPNGLFQANSRYVGGAALSPDGLETMLGWMQKWPGGSLLQKNIGLLYPIGGKVREKSRDATAYPHREANYMFMIEMMWAPMDGPDTVDRQHGWLTDYFQAMRPHLVDETYVNFPSRDLTDWARAYYAGNLDRLQNVKSTFDPNSVFRFEQSIKPKKKA